MHFESWSPRVAVSVGAGIGMVIGALAVSVSHPIGSTVVQPQASVYRAPRAAHAVRLDESADEVRLSICARRYEGPRLPTVWVAGVIHLAEPGFYAWVDTLLAGQQVVLYEGVTGPAPEHSESPDLGDFAEALGLVEQSGIDTDRAGWRNSDMSVGELESALIAAGAAPTYVDELLHEVGDGYGAAVEALAKVEHRFVAHARHALMTTLAIPPATSDDEAARLYQEVLIEARDAVVMEHLAEAAAEPGVDSVGVLYGVAHVDDLDRRLTAEGWHWSGEACETAMRVELGEIGLGHVQLRQVRERILGARLQNP